MTMDQNNSYIWTIDNPLGYKNRMGFYKTQKEFEFILRNLQHDNLRILDVGGGSGRFAHPLAARGHNLTIVDKSHSALDYCQAHSHNKIKCICDDFMDCSIEKESFEVVIAMECVLFFTDREKLFREINQVLVPGGIFIFTELNKFSWRYILHKMFRKKDGKYNVKSIEDYRSALKNTGFEVNDIEGFMWIPLTVISDSVLVDLFAYLESWLGLQKWIDQSPWLLIAAQKEIHI
jgi:2-polyprenyl-3-methyl-5-hydroxy-6-metoxy-1,4-benzoquinol methylase